MHNMSIQNIETESVNIFTKRLFIFFAKMRIQKSIQIFFLNGTANTIYTSDSTLQLIR